MSASHRPMGGDGLRSRRATVPPSLGASPRRWGGAGPRGVNPKKISTVAAEAESMRHRRDRVRSGTSTPISAFPAPSPVGDQAGRTVQVRHPAAGNRRRQLADLQQRAVAAERKVAEEAEARAAMAAIPGDRVMRRLVKCDVLSALRRGTDVIAMLKRSPTPARPPSATPRTPYRLGGAPMRMLSHAHRTTAGRAGAAGRRRTALRRPRRNSTPRTAAPRLARGS